MSLWQLAKLPRAAPVHADARLPMAVIAGDALRFSGGHPAAASCSQWLPLAPAPSWPPCWARTACCPWVVLSCQLEMVLNEAVVRHSLLGSSPLRLLQLPVVSTLIRKENSFPQSGPQPTVHTCLFPWQLVFLLLMAQSPVKSVS